MTPPAPQGGRAYTDMAVFQVSKATACDECGAEIGRRELLRSEGDRALCMECADLGHLEFLGSGDAALTRRASKHSALRAIVLAWSSSRKRYERQGILVERAAIDRAEEECATDEDQRARRREAAARTRDADDRAYIATFAHEVRRLFPGAPPKSETLIAEHACRKYSGRVGRSADAKALDEHAITLATVAHVRHVHTGYDALLMRLEDRAAARAEIRDAVDAVLAQWRRGR